MHTGVNKLPILQRLQQQNSYMPGEIFSKKEKKKKEMHHKLCIIYSGNVFSSQSWRTVSESLIQSSGAKVKSPYFLVLTIFI